jgi:hypothetical protein
MKLQQRLPLLEDVKENKIDKDIVAKMKKIAKDLRKVLDNDNIESNGDNGTGIITILIGSTEDSQKMGNDFPNIRKKVKKYFEKNGITENDNITLYTERTASYDPFTRLFVQYEVKSKNDWSSIWSKFSEEHGNDTIEDWLTKNYYPPKQK